MDIKKIEEERVKMDIRMMMMMMMDIKKMEVERVKIECFNWRCRFQTARQRTFGNKTLCVALTVSEAFSHLDHP